MRRSNRTAAHRCGAALLTSVALTMLPLASSAHDSLPAQIAGVTAEISHDRTNAELHVRRAELLRASRQWAQAKADLERAATLEPRLASIDLARARLAFDMGRSKAAAEAATRVLAREPEHLDARLIRARAGARLGQIRPAVADYTLVLAARAAPDLYVERALVTAGVSEASKDEALRGLDEGIARLGPVVTLELEAIGLELALRRYDSALARLDRMSEPIARKDGYLARRAAILEKAGRFDEAERAYREALTAVAALPSWAQHAPATLALAERLSGDLRRLSARHQALASRNH